MGECMPLIDMHRYSINCFDYSVFDLGRFKQFRHFKKLFEHLRIGDSASILFSGTTLSEADNIDDAARV